MKRDTRNTMWIVLTPLTVCIGLAAAGEDYDVPWWTIDGGGVVRSTGDDFELNGTIGQPDAGPGSFGMSGDDFALTGGFWFGLALDDCNSDGGVNLMDYDDFDGCLSGPEGGLPLPDCNCFDLDGDDDVDLSDVLQFQQAFTGG